MTRATPRAGFTLIEILLVITLLSFTSLAVMTSLIQGIKVFNRLNGASAGEQKAFLMERLTRDLKNGAQYSLLPWVISRQSLTFPTVTISEGGRNLLHGLPARVSYRFDSETKEVIRTEEIFPLGSGGSKTEVLADQVESLVFEALRNPDEKPEDSQKNVPLRIFVSLEYGKPSKMHSLKKNILIPAGYKEPSLVEEK